MTENDNIKEDLKQNISDYSLATLRKFVCEYQIFNAE